MQIDRVLFPIESLGPGRRIVVWTVGCSKHCYNCSNMELWKADSKRDVPIDMLMGFILSIIHENEVDGITFTGGDPFEQKDELLYLVKELHKYCEDILVYTGYMWTEFEKKLSSNEIKDIRENIAVIIDGPYIDELNKEECVLRGSINQNIIFNHEKLRFVYEDYMKQGRKIQNVYGADKVVSIGIHSKEENYGYQ